MNSYRMLRLLRATILVFFAFFFTIDGMAQDANAVFDKRYTEVFKHMGSISRETSGGSVDSLLKVSINPHQKSKSLMLKAIMSIISDQKSDALFYAVESEKEAMKSGVTHMQVRTAGFLSTLFIDAGLFQEALVYIDKAEKANAKMKESPEYSITQLKINDERAFYEYQNENFENAIAIQEKSKILIDQMDKEEQSGHLLYHHEAMGASYVGLKEYEKARERFQLALALMETTSNSLLEPKLYNGMAQVELQTQNYPEALGYLNRAESILDKNKEDGVQIMIYKSFSDYYKALDMHKEALHYEKLYSNAFNEKTRTTQGVFNELIKKSHETQKVNQTRIVYLIAFSGLAILLIIALLVRLRLIRKQERIKYEDLIKNINSNSPLNVQVKKAVRVKAVESSGEEQKKEPKMSKETEERILEALEKLEEELFFIKKDISLAALAAQLDTNTRYISYVVNIHKGKDFNNYINELRVRYIIKKFQTDSQYLSYKLAYIADEAGFSSHSKFTAVFKNFTGISPSVFITHIQKEISEKAGMIK